MHQFQTSNIPTYLQFLQIQRCLTLGKMRKMMSLLTRFFMEFSLFDVAFYRSGMVEIENNRTFAQWLKITKKVAFNIASEASYVYNFEWPKVH